MGERYRREIEEILQQHVEEPPGFRRPPGKGQGPRRIRPASLRPRVPVTPGRLFLVSASLLLASLVLYSTGRGVVSFFFWPGLVLFILAYALFFVRSEQRTELRWRGKPVEYGRSPSWWSRLRRLFRG